MDDFHDFHDIAGSDGPGRPGLVDVPSPETAWCTVTGANGWSLRTNSYEDLPDGSRFVAVLDSAGNQQGWWESTAWASPGTVQVTLAAIGALVSDHDIVGDDEYGHEYRWGLTHGSLRVCPNGSYVRFCDADGEPVDDGSAYWVCDEFVEDPELVMGAVLGVAQDLNAP